MVNRPTAVKGQKPVTIGHSYSMAAVLPERDEWDARWTTPLDIERVPTDRSAIQVAVEQVDAIMGMRGSKEHPMQTHPFTLIRVERRTAQGHRIGKVMWLIVIGKLRDQIDVREAYWAYRRRFDIEHSFRFLNRNLLLDAFQTPELEHEQDWVKLVMLAYVQLWAAQPISIEVPKPWERLKERQIYSRIPPSEVQQDWNRIIRLVGTPASEVKPRGKSPGRQSGQTQTPRKRHPVVKKGCSRTSDAKKAA